MEFFVNILIIHKTYNCYSIVLSFYFENWQVFLGHPVKRI